MLGAIIADIAGSVYEWHNIKNFSTRKSDESCKGRYYRTNYRWSAARR